MTHKFKVRINCEVKIQPQVVGSAETSDLIRLYHVEDMVNYYVRKLLYTLEPFIEHFINNEMRHNNDRLC